MKTVKAYPGIWTPWAAVVCVRCHGNVLANNRGPTPGWETRNRRTAQPANQVTPCDNCGRLTCVHPDVAFLHNLVAEVGAQGINMSMQQTGGMVPAAVHGTGHGYLVVTRFGELLVGFWPGRSWLGESDEQPTMLPLQDDDEIVSAILSLYPEC